MKPGKRSNHSRWVFVLALILAGCQPQEPAYTTRFLAFGTLIDLTVIGTDRNTFNDVSSAIEGDFAYMHSAWHAWEPGPLGRVNQLLPTGKEFAVPPSVLPLIEIGTRLSEASGHLFNPAIGRLIKLWGFQGGNLESRDPPAAEEVQKLVEANPRMTDLVLEGISLRCTNPAVQLDFGGFGKGYGIDLAVRHLRELGVQNAIVNAGGDLRAIGSRAGHPWRIAIRRPSGTGVFATIDVTGDASIFTSGHYERNFTHEGKTYHHIIDPRTGFPAEGAQSVTVVHTDATTADAAATALFIAGPDSWHQVATDMGIRYVVLVDSQGVLHMNPAMAERIELLDREVEVVISPPLGAPAPTGRHPAPSGAESAQEAPERN